MEKRINGLVVSDILYEELNNYLANKDKKISVVDILIGDDFGGKMYSVMKQKKITSKTCINFYSKHFESITEKELLDYLEILNNDEKINGIILQLPFPFYLNQSERKILDKISPVKDVDGLTTTSIGKLVAGEDTLIPCTPLGIISLLKAYDVLLDGKKVAIINRSNIVGKPLAHLMLKNNATPIICHSKTLNLKNITRDCDIVVAALNKQELITSDYISDGTVVIDVGVHKNKDGKTVGDVNYEDVYSKASLITPPVGAVGPMTICMLAYNCAKTVYGEEINEVLEQGIERAKLLIKTREFK